ncbi:MAG: SDR family oxidoreductase [Firmicutes bacterium]|nr:SDR family oxidoreductase [Bacillota bacterium]
MDLGLRGKNALITGGGRGIGKAIAMALAREGVNIAIASRNPEHETVQEIEGCGIKAYRLCVDVSTESQVVNMVREAIGIFGHLDFYVNNSANFWHESVTKITTENWRKTLDTNLSSCIWACREVSKHLIERRQGSILIVSSTIQFHPAYQESSYRITKVGLKAYAENLAIELAPFGIRVNVLSPGIMYTKMSSQNLDIVMNDPVLKESLLSSIPIGRLGQPDECGAAAALLLSDKVSSYTTGADIVIDGGYRLRPQTITHTTKEAIERLNL